MNLHFWNKNAFIRHCRIMHAQFGGLRTRAHTHAHKLSLRNSGISFICYSLQLFLEMQLVNYIFPRLTVACYFRARCLLGDIVGLWDVKIVWFCMMNSFNWRMINLIHVQSLVKIARIICGIWLWYWLAQEILCAETLPTRRTSDLASRYVGLALCTNEDGGCTHIYE